MKLPFLSLLRSPFASTAKFLLVFIITPTTARFQRFDLTGYDKNTSWNRAKGKFIFQNSFVLLIRFLSWFCQGMITLAYPAMGYNPIKSRREQTASQWASHLVDVPSSELEQEAQKTISQIQHSSSHSADGLMESPSFTVLICFHHHLKYFKSCLDSIKDACYHSPTTTVEILIINDDPSISSELLLSEASQLLQEKITLYSHKQNLGICYSVNQAIACAKGKWMLHLDCDDRLTPEVFCTLERVIKQHPHARFISSRAVDIDGDGNILSWRLRSELPSDLIHNNVASHLKVIRKDLHEDLGVFNSIFEGCQDYEFALRTAINEPLCFIPDYLYQYRWHDRSQTVSNNKRQNLTAIRIRQTYLLALYWMNHGIKNIQWKIIGPSAASWAHKVSLSSQPARYTVTLEATTPYAEHQWRLLLVQLATIIIDSYRNHEEESNLMIRI